MAQAARIALVLLALAPAPSLLAESDGEAPRAKLGGRLATGFAIDEFKNGSSTYDVELEIKTKRSDGARAVASLRGRSKDTAVQIEDAYLETKLDGKAELLFGQTKKRLGREYFEGDQRRLTIRRSPLYQKLEEFAFVGRELTIAHEKDDGKSSYRLSAGYAQSIDANVSLTVTEALGQSLWHAGGSILLQSDRIDAGRQVVYATILSLWQDADAVRSQLELAFGKDPFESEFERAFGDGRSVHFAAAKAQVGIPWKLQNGGSLEPLAQTTVIAHDLKTPRANTLQLLIGVNWLPKRDLRVGFDAEVIGSSSKLKPDERTYGESNAKVEGTFYF